MTEIQMQQSQLSANLVPPPSIVNPTRLDESSCHTMSSKGVKRHADHSAEVVIDLCDDDASVSGDLRVFDEDDYAVEFDEPLPSNFTSLSTVTAPPVAKPVNLVAKPLVSQQTARKQPRLALNTQPINRNDLAFTLQSFTDCFPSFPFDPNMLFSARFQDRNQVYLNDVAYYRCKDGFLLPLLACIVDCGSDELDSAKPRPGVCYKFRGKLAVGDCHMVVCPPHSNDYALYERVMRILHNINPFVYVSIWGRCHVDWVWFHAHVQEIAEAVIRHAQDTLEDETDDSHDALFFKMMYKGEVDDSDAYLHPYHWEEDCFCYPSAAGKPFFNISFDFVTFPPRPPINGLDNRIFRPVMWTDIHNI